jgi:type IV pilus assembly protein PilV
MKIMRSRPDRLNPGPGGQRGIGLIEVLIALVIFSVGMLSLVAMQLAAKRSIYEASQRSIATGLARDMIERMRSNKDQLDAYVVTNIGDESSLLGAPTTNCGTTSCTPAELAEYDLVDWESLLVGASEKLGSANAGGLVSPRACISLSGRTVTIAIAWLGVNSAVNPTESACGNDVAGLYDDPDETAGNNMKRRLLVLTSYIGST